MGAHSLEFGVPAGRFLELSLKTNQPGPYVITDQLSVEPPTKKRNEAMKAAQMAIMVNGQLLSQALKVGAGEGALDELTKRINDAESDYNHAFLGDAHDDVLAFFADEPAALWAAFTEDIKRHFVMSEPDAGDADAVGKENAPST